MKLKLVCITWLDADQESGWSTDDPKEKNIYLKTYGLLVRRDKDWIVHADTYNKDAKQWSGRGRIPKGMVKSVRTIEMVDV